MAHYINTTMNPNNAMHNHRVTLNVVRVALVAFVLCTYALTASTISLTSYGGHIRIWKLGGLGSHSLGRPSG